MERTHQKNRSKCDCIRQSDSLDEINCRLSAEDDYSLSLDSVSNQRIISFVIVDIQLLTRVAKVYIYKKEVIGNEETRFEGGFSRSARLTYMQ